LKGKDFGFWDDKQIRPSTMLWNMVDVRDAARAHRLAAESLNAKNGSRYILSATDRSGEMFTWELQAKLKELFPDIDRIGGEQMADGKPKNTTYDSPRSYCSLAQSELGLETYSIEETLLDTGNSQIQLGLV
jgi:nucleoside-diphosphate-sugar epimerase